jgi:GT2 family glycosyltransferase
VLSVIVPIYRNVNLVEYCLTILLENLPADAELILVDDASGPETVQLLKSFEGARLIEHPENRGNTVAYNTGAKAARGDLLAFVDSDVFVPPGALDELSRLLIEDDRLGAVGSLLLYPHDYTIQHAGVAFDKWTLSHLFVGRSTSEIDLKPVEDRQAVTAAFFACRRSVFEQVGGFDETYRDGLEDIEYCLRCCELGYRNVLASRFPAMHLESATRGPYKHIRRTYNYSIFFSRWAGRFRADLIDFVSASARRTLSNGNHLNYPAGVLNFCTTPNWRDLADAVFAAGVKPGTIHNLSGSQAESDPIDLFRSVPLAFQRLPSNILFVVDHFSQLMKNHLWFSRRLSSDIIVDRHANVLTSKEFGFSSQT